jgi:predicted PurR-regulated permease PerM
MYLNDKIADLKLARVFYWLGIMAFSVFFLQQFKAFLQPLVLAVLFWFLITDLSLVIGRIRFKNWVLPRWIRIFIAFVLVLSVIFVSVDLLSKNVELIIDRVPEFKSKINLLIDQVGAATGVEDIADRIQQKLSSIDLQAFLSEILRVLTSFIGYFFLILIYVIFLLIESVVFNKKMEVIFKVPERYQEIRMLLSRMASSVHAYLSVKSLVSLLTGLLSYIVLLLFQVDFPELWAFLIFFFNFIPYVGSFIATLLPSIFAMFQFNSFAYFIWVFLGVEAIQILVANYIEPKIIGRRLNLSPLIVILSLSFWGMIWGVLGMFLAVPITSIILIILSQFPSTHNVALLFSEKGDVHGPKDQTQSGEFQNRDA